MRARWWRLLAVGALLLGSCIAFFVVTSMRDDQLLSHGTRVTGSVIGHRPAAAWNPLDYGRAIVRYPTPAGELTHQIWLDDYHDAPASGGWTVVYDPAHPQRVRSLTDANDPVPWAPPMLLLGLAGLVLIVLSGAKLLAPRMQPAGPIPVRRYRLFSRPAWIDVADGAVQIRLPGYFGDAPMRIPAGEVCVVDDDRSPADYSAAGVYQRPIVVPYLATTTPNVRPNLTLFFSRPQRLPALRPLAAFNASLSYRASRSAPGLLVDGLNLRVVDPAAAADLLAAGGISRTDRPARWLSDHHPVTWNPTEIRRAARRENRRRWIGRLAIAAFLGINVLRIVHTGWALAVVVALVLFLLLLPWWERSRDRKEDPAGQSELGRHRAGRHSS